MANVTVHVTLRRIEGRSPVDLVALGEAVIDILAEQYGSEVVVGDDDLTYEITGIRLARSAATVLADDEDSTPCEWCQTPTVNDPHGRPRRFCSDIHRVAAWRASQRPQPTAAGRTPAGSRSER